MSSPLPTDSQMDLFYAEELEKKRLEKERLDEEELRQKPKSYKPVQPINPAAVSSPLPTDSKIRQMDLFYAEELEKLQKEIDEEDLQKKQKSYKAVQPINPSMAPESDSPIWGADDEIINVSKLHTDRRLKYFELNQILNKQKPYVSFKDITKIPPLQITDQISMPKTWDYTKILKNNNISNNINSTNFTLLNNEDNILFYEAFGSASSFGSNYKTLIYDENTSVTCSTKFVTCDMLLYDKKTGKKIPNSNIKEIFLLYQVSKFALYNVNPNVPIMYKSFKLDIDINSQPIIETIYPKFDKKKCTWPQVPDKHKAYAYCYMNEIFSGDARRFIINYSHQPDLIINAISNIIISILTFWSITNKTHNDCHMGNFLYKKLKYDRNSDEYYKYNIYGTTIYTQNLGFLWSSWDYGFAINNFAANINLRNSDIIRALAIFAFHLRDTDSNILCNLYFLYNKTKINYKYIHLFSSIIKHIKNIKKSPAETYNKFITYIFNNTIKQQQIFPIFDIYITANTLDTTKINKFKKLIYEVIKEYSDNIVSKNEGGNNEMIKRAKKISKGKKDYHACANISTNPSNLGAFPSNFTIIYKLFNNFFKLFKSAQDNKLLANYNDPTNKEIKYEYVKKLYFDIYREKEPKYANIINNDIFMHIYNAECYKEGKELYDKITTKSIWTNTIAVDTNKNLFSQRDEIIDVLTDMGKEYNNVFEKFRKGTEDYEYRYNFTHELSFFTFDFFNKYRDRIQAMGMGNKFFYNSTDLPKNSKIINKTPYYIGNGNIGYRWKKINDKYIIKHFTENGYDIEKSFKNPSIKDLFENGGEHITLNEKDIKKYNIDNILLQIYRPIGQFSLLYIINNKGEFYIINNNMDRLLQK